MSVILCTYSVPIVSLLLLPHHCIAHRYKSSIHTLILSVSIASILSLFYRCITNHCTSDIYMLILFQLHQSFYCYTVVRQVFTHSLYANYINLVTAVLLSRCFIHMFLIWAVDQLILEKRFICYKKSGSLWIKKVSIWNFKDRSKLQFSNNLLNIVVV